MTQFSLYLEPGWWIDGGREREKKQQRLGWVVHAGNPRIWEAKVGAA